MAKRARRGGTRGAMGEIEEEGEGSKEPSPRQLQEAALITPTRQRGPVAAANVVLV